MEFAIFNNRRSLVQLAAIKHTRTTLWVDIAKKKFYIQLIVNLGDTVYDYGIKPSEEI